MSLAANENFIFIRNDDFNALKKLGTLFNLTLEFGFKQNQTRILQFGILSL